MVYINIENYLPLLSKINNNLMVREDEVIIVNSFLDLVKRNYDRTESLFLDQEFAKIVSKIKLETNVDELRNLVKQLRELEF